MLPQRINFSRVSASLQSLPILEQFPPVDLRPCDDQARLAGRETPPNDFDVVDRKYSDTALVIGVEMGPRCGAPASTNIRTTIPKKRLISGNARIPPRTSFSSMADNWCPSARCRES